MAENLYLQPWIYAGNVIATHLDSGDTDFSHLGARIGQLRPCSIGGVQVDFSRVCQNATLLFDPYTSCELAELRLMGRTVYSQTRQLYEYADTVSCI